MFKRELKKSYYYSILACAAFLALFVFFYSNTCYGDQCDMVTLQINTSMSEIDTNQILKQNEDGEIFLLDVREVFEYESGYIPGAINIPLSVLGTSTVAGLPHSIPIFVYCRSGNRSTEAVDILNDLGYENTHNLGGIINWQEIGGLVTN